MANNSSTGSTSCSPHAVNAAIWGQRPLISTLIRERMVKQNKYMFSKVKEGSTVDPHDNSDTVILNQGLAESVGYSSYEDPFPDTCDGPSLRTGELPGQTGCNDQCGAVQMQTQVNNTPDNACDPGVQIIDYAQGFEFRGYEDARVQIATKERCIETLARNERKHVAEYIEKEAEFLAETAYLSFDRKLTDLVVKNGGANSVVRSYTFGEPVLTTGGWSPGADPNDTTNTNAGVKHVTIYYLERYREQIIERLKAATVPNAENYVLEIEMTREAWKFCLCTESLTRTGDGGIVNGLGEQIRLHAKLEEKMMEKGSMTGRSFDSWQGKIRVIFNDEPIRGFLRGTGQTAGGEPTYNFIRVLQYINEPSPDGAGLKTIPNQDYRRNTVTCEGQSYPLLELIPHIHSDSFTRHNLAQGIGPKGVNPLGANFQIQLLGAEYLSDKDCPNFGDKKYRYYIEHKFRFKNTRSEFSGFIMHRRFILPGYDADIINQELTVKTDVANATTRDCEVGEVEKCNDECPDDVCVGDGSDNTLELIPCGDVAVSYCGEDKLLRIAVERSGDCADLAAAVIFEVTDGTALSGTHYTVLDDDGNVAPLSDELSWGAGEFGTKYICFNIIGAIANDPDTQDACCNDVDGASNPATFTVNISTPTGAVLSGCDTLEVSINDRT